MTIYFSPLVVGAAVHQQRITPVDDTVDTGLINGHLATHWQTFEFAANFGFVEYEVDLLRNDGIIFIKKACFKGMKTYICINENSYLV